MTTRDFADPEIARWIAVLPVAAVEQHGPHLPLSVDATINEGILARALDLVDSAVPVTVLPAQIVGKSNEHLAFPGTLSISADTAIRLWTEIAECVARTGIRKLVLFNSHGGQPQIVDIVATDLRVRLGLLAVAANSYALADPADLFPAEEVKHGIHAGAIETSMIMALRPDDVRHAHLRDFPSLRRAMARDHAVLRAGGRVGFAWATQDLNPDGACGDARLADAGKGSALVERSARALATLFEDVDRFEMALLKAGPSDGP